MLAGAHLWLRRTEAGVESALLGAGFACLALFHSTMSSTSFFAFGPLVLRPRNTSDLSRLTSRSTTSGSDSYRLVVSDGSASRS